MRMRKREGGRLYVGLILIVLGLGLLALQVVEGLGSSVMMFFIGGLFLAGYLTRGSYGLLIPGGILIGVGLSSVGERALGSLGGVGSIGLGLGFLTIYVVAKVYEGRTHWWPLIPGGILVLSGLTSSSNLVAEMMEVGWPLLLILFGLLLLFGAGELRRRG